MRAIWTAIVDMSIRWSSGTVSWEIFLRLRCYKIRRRTKPIAALLSNYEVLSLLTESKQDNKSQKQLSTNQSLATICYEAKQYLEQTPCRHQNPEIIKDLFKAVEPFKLTKSEKLQILNLKPIDAVAMQLIIEESEERLSQEDLNTLTDVIINTLVDIKTFCCILHPRCDTSRLWSFWDPDNWVKVNSPNFHWPKVNSANALLYGALLYV
uniref:DNA-directed RNA polymerase III subunit RPC9 n=1 Tax=Strigamia maritima TaxID=126957 RepID=T1J506_STRMM